MTTQHDRKPYITLAWPVFGKYRSASPDTAKSMARKELVATFESDLKAIEAAIPSIINARKMPVYEPKPRSILRAG